MNETLQIFLALLGGGIGVELVRRFFSKTDTGEERRADIRKVQVEENASIRRELQEETRRLREEIREVDKQMDTWRQKYHELQGAFNAMKAELDAIRPSYYKLMGDYQAKLLEVEVLRRGDREALQRIEEAGKDAASAARIVASELASSQGRADATQGEAGEAADAASRSSEEEEKP